MKVSRKASDVLACSFSNWYPKFKKVTIDSVWLPLPEEVVTYASSDGTVVSGDTGPANAGNSDDDDDDSVDWESAEEDTPSLQRPEFATFDAAVREALAAFGSGGAFIKLNWSAPVDARWMSAGRALRSQTTDDVLLLLRSSDRLQQDLCRPFQECVDAEGATVAPHLVLRQWEDISPAAEFRCFVRLGVLIAVSQREISQYFPHLQRDAADIVTDVSSFFAESVRNKFPLQDYVFDVYRPTKDLVRLLDFSPFSPPTDPALFTWEQLRGQSCLRCGDSTEDGAPLCAACGGVVATLPVFQHIADADAIQRAPHAAAELPYDVTALAASNDTAAIVDLLRKSQLREAEGSSDDETDD